MVLDNNICASAESTKRERSLFEFGNAPEFLMQLQYLLGTVRTGSPKRLSISYEGTAKEAHSMPCSDHLFQIMYIKYGGFRMYRTHVTIERSEPTWNAVTSSLLDLMLYAEVKPQRGSAMDRIADIIRTFDAILCVLILVYDNKQAEVFFPCIEGDVDRLVEFALQGGDVRIERERLKALRRDPNMRELQYQQRKMSFPAETLVIGEAYLKEHMLLEQVEIPDSVKFIDAQAFSGCKKLTSVILPKGLSCIESSVFEGCEQITGITLPKHIKEIREYAFRFCSSLQTIELSDELAVIGHEAFKDCRSLRAFRLPDSLKSVGAGAFENCTSISAVRIPRNVRLGDGAFKNCCGLKQLILSEGVVIFGEGVFENCTGLVDVVIPEQITELEWYTFKGCRNLRSLTIADSVKRVGLGILDGCDNLERVSIPEHLKEARAFRKITDKMIIRN